jgi:hypothetical protein
MSPIVFLLWDVLLANPMAAPLWIAGLVALLAGSLKRFRAIGLAWIVTYLVLLAARGRFYYLLPAFVMIIAAGAVAVERMTEPQSRRWLRPCYALLIVIAGALLAPSAVPLLPPETYLRWAEVTHLGPPRFEHRATASMPQFFADRFGWPEMVATVARVYNALPPEERARTAIFGNDFGQSGAIDFYGPRYDLPRAIGGHLSNWYWGPRNYTGESILVLGDDREQVRDREADGRDRAPVRDAPGALHALPGEEAARLHAAVGVAAAEEVGMTIGRGRFAALTSPKSVATLPHPRTTAHSSRGPGRRPLTAVTRVRIPYALPISS